MKDEILEKKKVDESPPAVRRESFFSTHTIGGKAKDITSAMSDRLSALVSSMPKQATEATLDSLDVC